MRVTKVYTRTGDKGTTHLAGGTKVAKDDVRIEAYGTVDELNSVVGQARAVVVSLSCPQKSLLEQKLARIQNDLFDVGADLATPVGSRWEKMHHVGQEDVTRLEQWIDQFNDELSPLEEFILPAGGLASATLHVARTVCRRAERHTVTFTGVEPDAYGDCVRYLNRLSDFLFVAARWISHHTGEPEVLWQKSPPDPA